LELIEFFVRAVETDKNLRRHGYYVCTILSSLKMKQNILQIPLFVKDTNPEILTINEHGRIRDSYLLDPLQ
jgi:hypothetical protein